MQTVFFIKQLITCLTVYLFNILSDAFGSVRLSSLKKTCVNALITNIAGLYRIFVIFKRHPRKHQRLSYFLVHFIFIAA